MYKLTLYFENKEAMVFEIHSIKELDDLLKTYPQYTKMSLERIKTLKR